MPIHHITRRRGTTNHLRIFCELKKEKRTHTMVYYKEQEIIIKVILNNKNNKGGLSSMIKEIEVSRIIESVAQLCISACCHLPQDVSEAFKKAKKVELSPIGREILDQLLENAEIATEEDVAICQDTGMAVIFLEIGQDVHFVGGDLESAIHEGVRQGYTKGYLRKSVVAEPLYERKNTTDNTPAIIHTRIVPGNQVKIRMGPKGAGSENKSVVKMLVPADGIEGVKRIVVETIKTAGASCCPPTVIGVGIGGTMEQAALCAKKAAMRDIETQNQDSRYARLEEELLELVNQTGIGPQGLGGNITALKVHVEWYPTHIASLPIAVNINCHAARHSEVIL